MTYFVAMQELAENGELQERESLAKDRISLFATAIFFVSVKFLTDAFERTLKLYGFLFLLFLLYLVIQQILDKKTNQPFNFKELFKKTGFSTIVLLIGYNLTNLTNFISASFPGNLLFSTILSFLIGFSILFLVVFVFQIIEENSKI